MPVSYSKKIFHLLVLLIIFGAGYYIGAKYEVLFRTRPAVEGPAARGWSGLLGVAPFSSPGGNE